MTRRTAAARVSAVATIGYCAFLVGPPVIGFVGEHIGLLQGLLVVLVLVVLAGSVSQAAREPQPRRRAVRAAVAAGRTRAPARRNGRSSSGAATRSGVAHSGNLERVRLVIARCSVDYAGRLSAHLPLATRLLMIKADGSVLVHSDSLSLQAAELDEPALRVLSVRRARSTSRPMPASPSSGGSPTPKTGDLLVISIHEILHDSAHELGIDPGLTKDGVEADLQRLLAEQIELLGEGYRLVRREYMTAIGPVDILRDGCRRAARSRSRSSAAATSTGSSSSPATSS